MPLKMPTWLRAVDMAIGVISLLAALIVALNPSYGTNTIATLLILSLVFGALRMFMTGGARQLSAAFRGLGVVAGLISLAILAFLIFSPGLGFETLVLLVAAAMAIQGVNNLAHVLHQGHPRWLRVSSLTVGLLILFLAVVAVLLPGLPSSRSSPSSPSTSGSRDSAA